MFRRLKDLDHRYSELESLLSDPDVVGKQALYQKYAKEHSDLGELVTTYRRYEQLLGGHWKTHRRSSGARMKS